MSEIIFIVEDAPEGGLVARAVGEGIFTQAATVAELRDRIRVHKRFAPVPPILGDGSRLGQVFVNLLLNAIHAIGAEGDITIEVAESDGQARCTIRDTGTGSLLFAGRLVNPQAK